MTQQIEQGQSGTVDAAKAQTREVAHTAADEAGRVTHEAIDAGRRLMDEAKTRVRTQSQQQTERAADNAQRLAEQARALADGRTDEAGPLVDLVREGASRIEQWANRLRSGGIDGVVDETRRFAGRRPGMFLLGALAAGFVSGRMVRVAPEVTDELQRQQQQHGDQYSMGMPMFDEGGLVTTGGVSSGELGSHGVIGTDVGGMPVGAGGMPLADVGSMPNPGDQPGTSSEGPRTGIDLTKDEQARLGDIHPEVG